MKTKRFAASLLAAVLALALSACGGKAAAGDDENAAPNHGGAAEPQAVEPSAAPAGTWNEGGPTSGKILVAYFSATNNTEGVAQKLAEGLGADLYEITPE